MAKRRGLWLVWCAMLGALYLFENNTATRILLVCSVLLPLIDGLMVCLAARRLRLSIDAPEQVEKRRELPLTAHVACGVPMARFRARIQAENRLTEETAQCTAWMRRTGHGRVVRRCLLQVETCGMLEIRLELTVSGLLGLLEYKVDRQAMAAVWVPPTIQPVQLMVGETGFLQEDDVAARQALPHSVGDSFTVREYVPGDPVRRIHWKLSGKMDTLIIREEDASASESLLLAADFSAADAATVSDWTEMLLSLSHALLEGGIPHDVLWLPSKSMQPELRRMETPVDLAAFETDFFSLAPHRTLPLEPGAAVQPYAHVVFIGSALFPEAFAHWPGQRITQLIHKEELCEPITL